MRKLPPKIFYASVFFPPLAFLPLGAIGDDHTRESEIAEVATRLSEAWQSGDGAAWAEEFVEDADFTVWFGLRLRGKEEIAFGHQMIFDNLYENTTFEIAVEDVRFLGDDIAIAHLAGSVVEDGESAPDEPDAVPLIVLERQAGAWKIVAFQNTPFAVNEFRANGDIKRLKQLAAQ